MVAELAYVAGLLATDGNLGQRKPVITIVSKDTDLLETVRRCLAVTTPIDGSIGVTRRRGNHAIWRLRYAKTDSIGLLRWMYYASDVPCLNRKRLRAEKFLAPLGKAPGGRTGRPRVGWLYNTNSHF